MKDPSNRKNLVYFTRLLLIQRGLFGSVLNHRHLSNRYALEFIGLDEEYMRDISFEDIRISGQNQGWHCVDTAGFKFKGTVIPAPSSNCTR